jgi:hypothetical protein
MRRLTLLLVLVLAAPAQAAKLRVTSPEETIAAHPHAASLAAEIEVTGRARRYSLVELRTRCELGTCRVSTYANRRGRFTALLNAVLPRERRHLRLRVASGEEELTLRYALSLPAYASASPYADDTRVPELVMIGDSLAVGTDEPLRADLPGWRVTSDGRVSRPLAEGMGMLGMTPLPTTPRALAFSLFTNDDPREVDALESAVRAGLLRLGSRDCALWATIVRPKVDGVSYDAANERLRDLADEDDRIRVVDWAAAIKRHRDWLSKDKVHPTADGYAHRARMYARAAQLCAEDHGWSLANSA